MILLLAAVVPPLFFGALYHSVALIFIFYSFTSTRTFFHKYLYFIKHALIHHQNRRSPRICCSPSGFYAQSIAQVRTGQSRHDRQKEELQDELLKIWHNQKITVMMITHDIDEALYLSDRILLMTDGPAAKIGEILTLPFARPCDRARLQDDLQSYSTRNYILEFLYERFAHHE